MTISNAALKAIQANHLSRQTEELEVLYAEITDLNALLNVTGLEMSEADKSKLRVALEFKYREFNQLTSLKYATQILERVYSMRDQVDNADKTLH